MDPFPKSYPDYKPSGVEWLEDVPAHWEIRRLRNIVEMRVSNVDKHVKEDEKPVRLCNYVDVYKNDYINSKMDFMQATATSEEIERFRLEKDDVLITKDSESWDDIGVPALVTEPASDLISGYHLALLRPRSENIAGGYLLRALQSNSSAYQFHVEAKGVTRYGLSHAGIKSAWLPVPPLPEQSSIIRYLDHATENIRRYISAKERLINLLEEQRQAIIHRVVTRGLDLNVRLKPSGVEWLGDVPAHWEVRRLRNVGEALIGLTYAPQDVVDEEDGILVLRASNISGGRIVYEDNVFVRCSVPSRLITRIGDILICSRSGSQTLIGKNARIDLASSGVTFGAFMTIFRSTNNDYLYYVFNSKLFEYQSGAYQTSTINQLTLNILYDIKIPLPPLAEQKQITRYLDRITSSIDTAINCARREIELLKEYRTRLIVDVVTGKLDVREAAFKLPEKSDRLSPYDDVNDLTEIRMIDARAH